MIMQVTCSVQATRPGTCSCRATADNWSYYSCAQRFCSLSWGHRERLQRPRTSLSCSPLTCTNGSKKTQAAAWGELGGVLVGEMGQMPKVRGYTAPLPRVPKSSLTHRDGGESGGHRV